MHIIINIVLLNIKFNYIKNVCIKNESNSLITKTAFMRYMMENNVLIKSESTPFLYRQIFLFKVNKAIKDCNSMHEKLKTMGLLEKGDEKLNLLIPVFSSFEIDKKYFLFKGYNSDGSLKPMKKYCSNNETLEEDNSVINIDISVVDIYEKNIYLYNYQMDDRFIEGYLIKEENKNKCRSMIFTKEKVKVLIKNTNSIQTLNDVEEFINKFIM